MEIEASLCFYIIQYYCAIRLCYTTVLYYCAILRCIQVDSRDVLSWSVLYWQFQLALLGIDDGIHSIHPQPRSGQASNACLPHSTESHKYCTAMQLAGEVELC